MALKITAAILAIFALSVQALAYASDDQIANDRQAGQRTEHDRLGQFIEIRDARQTVLAVDIHRV